MLNPETGQSYDLTVRIVLSDSFTKVFLEQAVSFFYFSSLVFDSVYWFTNTSRTNRKDHI